MRFVLYDDETMEPITVINLPGITERDAKEQRWGAVLRLPVPEPVQFRVTDFEDVAYRPMRVV